MCSFLGLGGSPTSWLHTHSPIIESELTVKLHRVYISCFLYLYMSWARSLCISICPHRQGEQGASECIDAGQERTRWWPSILVLHLHSGGVGPAFRVDFGQFFIKSCNASSATSTCTCNITSQACLYWHHELAPPPTFAFGKIVPSGLKIGAEHSNV